MGREVRMVPEGWEHPKTAEGHYRPLLTNFSKRLAEWDEASAQWEKGFMRCWVSNPFREFWGPRDPKYAALTYEEYDSPRPNPSDYMPDWPDDVRTHYMMYETCSEGTPISPAFETPEQLASWLWVNEASAFGHMKATYDEWLAVIKRGGEVISAVWSPERGMESGVSAEARFDKEAK